MQKIKILPEGRVILKAYVPNKVSPVSIAAAVSNMLVSEEVSKNESTSCRELRPCPDKNVTQRQMNVIHVFGIFIVQCFIS